MRKIYLCGSCIQGLENYMESIYVGREVEVLVDQMDGKDYYDDKVYR